MSAAEAVPASPRLRALAWALFAAAGALAVGGTVARLTEALHPSFDLMLAVADMPADPNAMGTDSLVPPLVESLDRDTKE